MTNVHYGVQQVSTYNIPNTYYPNDVPIVCGGAFIPALSDKTIEYLKSKFQSDWQATFGENPIESPHKHIVLLRSVFNEWGVSMMKENVYTGDQTSTKVAGLLYLTGQLIPLVAAVALHFFAVASKPLIGVPALLAFSWFVGHLAILDLYSIAAEKSMKIPLTQNPITDKVVRAIGGLVYTDFTMCGNKLGLVAKSQGSLRLHYSDDYEVKKGALLLLAGQIASVVGIIALPYIFSIKATLLGWSACGFALKHINQAAIGRKNDLLLKALHSTKDESVLTFYDKIYAVWNLVGVAYLRSWMLNRQIIFLNRKCTLDYKKFQKFFQTPDILKHFEQLERDDQLNTEEIKQIDGEVAWALKFYNKERG